MKYKTIRGFNDILPEECARRQEIEDAARRMFSLAGYREIRTPVVEETALFVKSVGEGTDIVNKEMFSFTDRGEREVTLRPEGTAPIVRAYIESNLCKTKPFQKLYYMGPMFRAERPQAGRLRQFYQIGLEALGASGPAMDAEVIAILMRFLGESGVKDTELKLNNLGCADDKKKLSRSLKEALSKRPAVGLLCEDCVKRLETNPLRALDCKKESCRAAVRDAYKSVNFLCGACRSHFDDVASLLKKSGTEFTIDPYIVRGLDYYTSTVFEVVQGSLGAQNAIAAGGRYDNLVSEMGGPSVGACGFAIGLDRLMLSLGEVPGGAKGTAVDVFIATMGKAAVEQAFVVINALRSSGISCDTDYEARSLKSQMRSADEMGAKYVIIIGDDELKKKEATVRDMRTKEQSSVKFDMLIDELLRRVRSLG